MKEIKLTGKERTVLRFMDWALGTTGAELVESTKLDREELLGILNGLMDAGYAETNPYSEKVSDEAFDGTTFEVNPGYALALKEAMRSR